VNPTDGSAVVEEHPCHLLGWEGVGERRRARRRCGELGRRSPGMCASNVESSHGLCRLLWIAMRGEGDWRIWG
jgi:hypothetical protein